MVSRLLGKLEAQRQRRFGREGVWATACVTAAALATAVPPAMNLRRFMGKLLARGGEGRAVAGPFLRNRAAGASHRRYERSCRLERKAFHAMGHQATLLVERALFHAHLAARG